MYKVNKKTNSVSKLEQKLFKELHIKEREHLQEWIANNPEMLGEELLIIQKEFDGFNDTLERLDLLALDKEGGLVIIENKLDDTGRNVVWQALKYTSYCSTLTTSQIIKIYQDYLDENNISEDAKENIIDFLGSGDEEILLNKNDQRIIFVANHFRKEVTSTVLWLLNHDIQIQCFRATPYSMGEEIFLQIEQIIPLPETKEFMIDAKEKEKEEKSKSKVVEDREHRLVEFWSKLKEVLIADNINYLDNVTSKPHFSIGFLNGAGRYAFCLGKQSLRVELYFGNDSNKKIIDTMAKYNNEIQSKLDNKVIWERLEAKKASRIKYEIPYIEIKNTDGKFATTENWDAYLNWYKDSMVKFYKVISPIWEKVQKELD
ncbi:MAG: DUF4268 domain-containing protein [Ignavibacteriales bacterium]|nr:DUF4268 domain-containing protein [Ignavibacteriales bacterium]